MISDSIQHVVDNHPAYIKQINDMVDYLRGKKTETKPTKPNDVVVVIDDPVDPVEPGTNTNAGGNTNGNSNVIGGNSNTNGNGLVEEPVSVTPPKRDAIMLVSRRWKDHPKTGKPIVKGTLDVALGASSNESK